MEIWWTNVCKENYRNLCAERIEIEKKESAVFTVLNVHCHNLECIARGQDDQTYHIDRFRYLLRNVFVFDGWRAGKVKKQD